VILADVGVQVARSLLTEREAVAEAVLIVPDLSNASMPSWMTSCTRSAMERPTVKSAKHGVGDVANA